MVAERQERARAAELIASIQKDINDLHKQAEVLPEAPGQHAALGPRAGR